MTRGVRQIVRFNWPFYAVAAAALALAPPVDPPPAATGRRPPCPLCRNRIGRLLGGRVARRVVDRLRPLAADAVGLAAARAGLPAGGVDQHSLRARRIDAESARAPRRARPRLRHVRSGRDDSSRRSLASAFGGASPPTCSRNTSTSATCRCRTARSRQRCCSSRRTSCEPTMPGSRSSRSCGGYWVRAGGSSSPNISATPPISSRSGRAFFTSTRAAPGPLLRADPLRHPRGIPDHAVRATASSC